VHYDESRPGVRPKPIMDAAKSGETNVNIRVKRLRGTDRKATQVLALGRRGRGQKRRNRANLDTSREVAAFGRSSAADGLEKAASGCRLEQEGLSLRELKLGRKEDVAGR